MSCEVRRCPAGLGEVLRGFCESWDLSLARSHICQNMTVKISMRQYHSLSDLSSVCLSVDKFETLSHSEFSTYQHDINTIL